MLGQQLISILQIQLRERKFLLRIHPNLNKSLLTQPFSFLESRAFNSFLLQLSLLLLILFSLGLLRSDAVRLVIAPLRRMLKIVLRCE